MLWNKIHRRATFEMLGLIPGFLSESSDLSAAAQIDKYYSHGGGWRPISGFKKVGETFQYPGDPPLTLLFTTQLRDEMIYFFDGAWLAIVQPNGTFEIARID